MLKVAAINGSPRTDRGHTATVLASFLEGMEGAGAEVELFYASRLKVKPCACGEMYCWYRKPGECCIQDDMQTLYPKLSDADILVLATPVYIPLPGEMQNVINRLCPLGEPYLETREGRTRARLREHVRIRKIALVSTGGWWEKENMGTVVRIAQEFAEDMSVEFAGAVLRPHASLMQVQRELTTDGQAILEAVRVAGHDLIQEGRIAPETLETIARPLISQEELRHRYNEMLKAVASRQA